MNLDSIKAKVKDLKRNTKRYGERYELPLEEKHILIESKNGGDLAGNMFAILRELRKPEYSDYVVYLVL